MPPVDTLTRQLSFATGVAAALALSGCGPRPAQAKPEARACANDRGNRVPDDDCNSGRGGARWYYGGNAYGSNYGDKLSGGSHQAPRAGGFGASARGSSGG